MKKSEVIKLYFIRILAAILNTTWQFDALYYYKGKGMATFFAYEKAMKMKKEEWMEIVKNFH